MNKVEIVLANTGERMMIEPGTQVAKLAEEYEKSKTLAEMIQSAARERLATENAREVKKSTSSIYVLDRAEIPAALVECGFLSSPDDLARLTDPGYRRRLSALIFSQTAKFMAEDDSSY